MASNPFIIQPPGYLTRFSRIELVPGRLPHWEAYGVATFVTLRLRDSLPREKLAAWQEELDEWRREHRQPWTNDELNEYKARFLGQVEKWLDVGYGSCILGVSSNRQFIEDALRHAAGTRYSLYAFVVKPNHAHVLLMPREGESVAGIIRDFKRYTGRALSSAKTWKGPLWEDEYWDTAIRDVEHFNRVRAYIKANDPALVFDAYGE